MPIIESHFRGNAIFKGAHADTILPPMFRNLQVNYHRERLELEDGDFLDLDWHQKSNKKLLVLFHGLEGSSQSQYIKGFARYFGPNAYDICAVNFRSCSGEANRLLGSYHNGSTYDIHSVLKHILKKYDYPALYLSGFSLGGNVLLKYLGDGVHKPDVKIKSATAFSVPIDLAACSKQLAHFSNKMYMNRFLSTLNQKLKEKKLRYPHKLDLRNLETIRNFEEWDTRFTAPIHGYKDAADYYAKCSSNQFLHRISIPTLLINAQNDPFLTPDCFPKNIEDTGLNVYFESPKYGGHAGFSHSWPNGRYYSEERAQWFFTENG